MSPSLVLSVADALFTKEEYKERCFVCRQRGGLQVGELHKKRWQAKKRPSSPLFKKGPNLLESLFGDKIATAIPDFKIRYCVWKTLWDKTQKRYWNLEVDIVLNDDRSRYCILCDGRAFHGPDSYFRGDTVKTDEYRSCLLLTRNPYLFRYSDDEIKGDFAIRHLVKTLEDIKEKRLSSFYRTWMVPSLS